MALQMRLSATDSRLYSPDRDLAYCTPHMIMRVMVGLDPELQEAWVKEYISKNNVTDEDLVKAAEVMAAYMNTAITDPAYKTPLEALSAAGFRDLPEVAQYLLCAKLGQVLLSASFCAIRDVTKDPKTPPYDCAAIEAVAIELRKKHEQLSTWKGWLFSWYTKVRSYFVNAS